MRKKEKREKGNFFALLNPKNLEREVHAYGYNFSWKSHLLVLFASLAGISAIGLLFKLQPVFFTAIIITTMALLPMLILTSYKRMYEQRRFTNAVTYMEQVLYSFQKSGKVASALQETLELFDEGSNMSQLINQALAYMNEGHAQTEQGVLREALSIIEQGYSCKKIHTVHELIAVNEEHGGDSSDAIELVLADLDLYKRRGYKLQAEKKTSHTDNMISIIVATLLCAVALYVLDAMGSMFPAATVDIDIFGIGAIQVTSMLFIFFALFVLFRSQQSLAGDWLQSEALQKEEYILSSYDMVIGYDEDREKRRSVIFAAPFFIGAALSLYFYSLWLGLVLLIAGVVMLCRHRIGCSLAKKDVSDALYDAMPQWLIEIALLMQYNNVQVSLIKSIQDAPAILQKELGLLVERLDAAPESLRSYTDFCAKFDVPEAASCMKMLHAISESGTGDAQVQIGNLIQRVNEMQDIADDIRNKSIAFKARMLFAYPLGGASVKLLVDLSIGMIMMMGLLGSMGGLA